MKRHLVPLVTTIAAGLSCNPSGPGPSGDGASSGQNVVLVDGQDDTGEPVSSRYPGAGVFVDAPIEGLRWACAELSGTTDVDGAFLYFLGEEVVFTVGSLPVGSVVGQHTVSPLDLAPGYDATDPAALNRARFLQSIDVDGQPADLITVTPEVAALVDDALASRGLAELDWEDDAAVEELISAVVAGASGLPGHALSAVSSEEAYTNLQGGLLAHDAWKVNVSHTPTLATAKGRIDALSVWVPARDADGALVGGWAHPLLVTFLDEVEGTGAMDVFVGVSLDDGLTWHVANVSQTATRSSFTLANGDAFPGDSGKATVKALEDRALLSWNDRYCPSSDPGGLGEGNDLYGVTGEQGSVDYSLDERVFDLGEVPYSCVWTARVWVEPDGEVVITRPEQLTSGRRDSIQDNNSAWKKVGFGVAWQEDPGGLRPGEGDGPGEGLSGALVNARTDIWYSALSWGSFDKLDESYDPQSDPDARRDEHGEVRPKPAVPFSSPVRMTDNESCTWSGGEVQGDGYCAELCVGAEGTACVTESGQVLDGDHGASRPNLFFVPKSKTAPDGSTTNTATAVIAYEESKQAPGGSPEDTGHDGTGEGMEGGGKTIQYHAFEYDKPDTVAAGTTMSDPELNARRARLVVQPGSKVGEADLRAVLLFRQGEGGGCQAADIIVRLAAGGYSASSFGEPLNLSSPSVHLTTEVDGQTRVVDWQWTEADLLGSDNDYDDARAHRALLRGDFLAVGYTWTPNWEAGRVGEDHYEFYLRRSFDGGATWTNAAGEFEPPRQISKLDGHATTVGEPRLVGTPGSITQADGSYYMPSDEQDGDVFFVGYGVNVNSETGADLDLYWARTVDLGETYSAIVEVDPTTGVFTSTMDWMAQSPDAESEAQLRTTPDGSALYASWIQLQDDEQWPHSDFWVRRLDLGK